MGADVPAGVLSTPSTPAPAPPQHTISNSPWAFLAPEGEHAEAQPPTKYTAIWKRTHVQTAPETQTPQNAPLSRATFGFDLGEPVEDFKTMLHKVLADNDDLKHQVTALTAEVTAMNSLL